MKKSFLIITFLLALSISMFSQAPQTFNYQAVARDQGGSLIANQDLNVRIGILQDGALVWQEDHEVRTNDLGIFMLSIGDPDALNQSGSAGSFGEIAWADGKLQMEVSLDTGSGFSLIGSSDFQSVPYALYAADGPGGTGPQGPQGIQGPPGDPASDDQELLLAGDTLSITGGNSVILPVSSEGGSDWETIQDTISTFKYVGIGTSNPNQSALAVQGLNIQNETPLFEVRREDGFPVFAVYNDGVMVYVDETAKGRKGGFAVGGYSRTVKGLEQEYLSVTPDSVRIYVPETVPAKGRKGGFAVGGYSRTKGLSQDLLFVNSDSTRVYVPNKANDDPNFQGLQGGFAVTGYTEGAKAAPEYLMGINRGITRFNTANNDEGFSIGNQSEGWGNKYLELTPTNSFIGNDAGLNTKPVDPVDPNGWGLSTMNVFMGYQSGMENLYGHHNTFLGFCAGTKTLGNSQDPELGSHNIFIGSQAGFENTEGSYNVYLGHHAGFFNTTGTDNVFIGTNAGATGSGTFASTMIGANAGREYSGGGDVTFIGRWAGNNNNGERNTFLGRSAGANTGGGSDNVAVGMRAGQYVAGDRNVSVGAEAGKGSNGSSSFNDNTLIGNNAGLQLTTGSNNVILGSFAGYSNKTGGGNVFLGKQAGYFETGSNQLYIDNSTTGNPLIWGDFSGNNVIIYGDLDVQGNLYYASDISLKKNIQTLDHSLDKVLQLTGVSFEWADESHAKGNNSVSSIGVIAQDVEKVLPNLVNESRNGTKTVNYSGLIPVLLEAVKEQQSQIEALEKRIAELER